jgi:cardiolipin synthase
VLTLPNAITLIRLVGVVAFPFVLATESNLSALALLALLASSDWLDGFVARSHRSVTSLGTKLDPAVDRVMMIVIVLSMISAGYMWRWLGAALIVREVLTSIIGIFGLAPLERAGFASPKVHWTGKVGFTASAAGLIVLLSSPPMPSVVADSVGMLLCLLGLGFGAVAVAHYAAFAFRARNAGLR